MGTDTNVAAALALAAERDEWRAKYLAAHEIAAAVEQLLDVGVISEGALTVTVDLALFDDVRNHFDAWRQLVEGGVPSLWTVAEPQRKRVYVQVAGRRYEITDISGLDMVTNTWQHAEGIEPLMTTITVRAGGQVIYSGTDRATLEETADSQTYIFPNPTGGTP